MAEWLYEAGIGEARAALVEGERLLEMAVEWDDDGQRAGAVCPARLTRKADASARALVTLDDGAPAHLAPSPAGLTEGARLLVEIVREAHPEQGALKPARVRVAPAGATPAPGPGLYARIVAGGLRVRRLADRSDLLDRHGWTEALEEAASGLLAGPGVMLRIALTPAMTLIDVDGGGAAAALAVAGAAAAGRAIRRYDIAGSIGIDLPTMAAKADRQAAAAALDAALPAPFERTAVNGFGFLQIVRRRVRPSLMDRLAADPVGAAARALMQAGERAGGSGALTLAGAPAVIGRIAARADWIEALSTRIGAPVGLRDEPARAISAGHAFRAFP